MRLQAKGSTRLAAPTSTAVAPAIIISSTSAAVDMPPMPITGMSTARATWYTIRRATGNTAGPDRPPVVLAMTGRRVRRSMRMPISVLIRLRPSAPASAQALAMATMSVTLGDSFMITGLVVTAFTARVTSAAQAGSVPKLMPPWWTLGQEMLTSSQPTCAQPSSMAQVWTYSSTENPETLAITGLWKIFAMFGSSSATTFSTPGFCSPTAFSMPAGASAMRGSGLPSRGCSVVPLKEKAAEDVDIVQLGELPPIPEGARGGDHRVGQLDAEEVYAGVGHGIKSFLYNEE